MSPTAKAEVVLPTLILQNIKTVLLFFVILTIKPIQCVCYGHQTLQQDYIAILKLLQHFTNKLDLVLPDRN